MKYLIRKNIVRNNFSEILLADYDDQVQSCRVLIKTIFPEINEAALERLNVAKLLNHPNILDIIDFGECKNCSPEKNYITSRYFPGVTLTQLISRLDTLHKKVPMPFLVHILVSICNALEYIHDLTFGKKDNIPLFHGNICPDNIFIYYDGTVSLVDCGIADVVMFRYSGAGLVVNSRTLFQHPDVVFGKPVKRQQEVYSVGLLLFCMLIGKNHFESFFDGNESHKLRSVRQFFPSIPSELDKIIARSTRYKGFGRFAKYEKISELLGDLMDYSLSHSIGYDNEISSLIIYTLFNQNSDFPHDQHEIQFKKALEYVRNGNDNALKMLLSEQLGIDENAISQYNSCQDASIDGHVLHDKDSFRPLPSSMKRVAATEYTSENDTLYLVMENKDEKYDQDYLEAVTITETHQFFQADHEGTERVDKNAEILYEYRKPESQLELTIPPITKNTNEGTDADSLSFLHHEASNTIHAFSKIVKKPYVFDALIMETPISDSQLSKNSTNSHSEGKISHNTVRSEYEHSASIADPFSSLRKKPELSTENKYIEPFSKLLKKENRVV